MHPHRVQIFDGTYNDAIIGGIAHHLHLEFLPAKDGFLDQHFADRRQAQAVADNFLKFGVVIGNAATFAAEGK